MNPNTPDDLRRFTDDRLARPLPAALRTARRDVLAGVAELRTIRDDRLTGMWSWRGGSEEEIRYGFYRIAESFELAGIEAAAAIRVSATERGRAADRIAPATAARWDLHGLLIPLPSATWDADPGGGEWTIRRTLGHTISSQRSYGVTTAWWQTQPWSPDDPDLPVSVPDEVRDALPDEEAEGEGSPDEVRGRLDRLLDESTDRLAGLPADRLARGARWSGFAVDVEFRLGRWGSHIREHTIQVEKTLAMLDRRPTEVDRLVRHVLATWGLAESVVFGSTAMEGPVAVLGEAARRARAIASEVAGLAASES